MSFDTLAPHYRWMERVLAGQKLQRCRTHFLQKIPTPERALLAGEGNGRFLVEFVRKFPTTEIVCLDASEKMLAAASASIAHANHSSIEFIHADLFDWKSPSNHFDLIVTNFFLDCFTADQLGRVVPLLTNAATSNATWLLTDFCSARAGWKRLRTQSILASMYVFFGFATKLPACQLTPPDTFLRAGGFELLDRAFFDWDLLHADLWQRTA
jgi:ubiquinone/menaquinone biosynthesis C-methylase UbiE